MNELSKKSSLRARNLLLSMSLGMFLILLVAASNNPMIFVIVPEGGGGGGGGPSPVFIKGDDYDDITRSESGTGDAFYERITQYDYVKLELKASAYWDLVQPRGGSADIVLTYSITPSTAGLNSYDLKTTWYWIGRLFDNDEAGVFVQLKITTRIYSSVEGLDMQDVKTWGGNGANDFSWDQDVRLTHFTNLLLRGGVKYIVKITVHVEANGAFPFSGTDYVDFMDGSREMRLKFVYIFP